MLRAGQSGPLRKNEVLSPQCLPSIPAISQSLPSTTEAVFPWLLVARMDNGSWSPNASRALGEFAHGGINRIPGGQKSSARRYSHQA